MNKEEIQEIAERITPRERKIIERLKKLSVEEIYVRKQRQLYNDIALLLIVMFFIFQLPLRVLLTALGHYTLPSLAFIFISILMQQAAIVAIFIIVVYFYCYMLDYFLDLHYFRKEKEIVKKRRGENGIQSKKH